MIRPLLLAAAVAAVAVLAPFLKGYGLYLLTYWLLFILATFGLNLTVGYAGQKSLGHAAFFGIGAYAVAVAAKAGLGFWLGMPAGMVLCFSIGLLLGFPALRVQTIYLAFATLGFNIAVWLFMRNEVWLTGGTQGLNGIGRPSLFGLSLDDDLSFFYFTLGVTVLFAGLLWGMLRSPWGKAFTALRDNPIRAESLGVNVRAYTLLSFAIGAVYAGVAGGLFAALVDYIEPGPFSLDTSINMYLMVAVGGAGYFLGPVLGSVIGVLLPEWLRFAQGWYLFVFGLFVIVIMVRLPDGLLSLPDQLRAKRQARAAREAATRPAAVRP